MCKVIRIAPTPVQCSPTKPSLKGKKFYLFAAASNTSKVSIPSLLNIIEGSLINTIFTSRRVFSLTLSVSAISRVEPAFLITRYSLSLGLIHSDIPCKKIFT